MFLNSNKPVEKHANRLPHWQQDQAMVFVTWRLADSLPQAKLDLWRTEREAWLVAHPEPWDERTEDEYHVRFSDRLDEWLDAGEGSCVLREPVITRIVSEALQHFDGVRCLMGSFVVMPNHVHALFQLLSGQKLEDLVHSWKGFTTRGINSVLGRSGSLWQERYWDRLIRHELHLLRCREYIRQNPVKARLRPEEYLLWYR